MHNHYPLFFRYTLQHFHPADDACTVAYIQRKLLNAVTHGKVKNNNMHAPKQYTWSEDQSPNIFLSIPKLMPFHPLLHRHLFFHYRSIVFFFSLSPTLIAANPLQFHCLFSVHPSSKLLLAYIIPLAGFSQVNPHCSPKRNFQFSSSSVSCL